MSEPSRNSLCECGSGVKFKHCCMGKPAPSAKAKKLNIIAGGVAAGGIIISLCGGYYWGWETAAQVAVVSVIFAAGLRLFLNPPAATRDRSGSGNINFGK